MLQKVDELVCAASLVDSRLASVMTNEASASIRYTFSSLNPPGVVAAVNFAGGSGGNPRTRPQDPCQPEALEATYARYGASAKMPTLWLYSENDRYFGSVLPRKWFDAFIASGGQGRFVQLPAYKNDGHASFTRNPDVWKPAFEVFLKEVGF